MLVLGALGFRDRKETDVPQLICSVSLIAKRSGFSRTRTTTSTRTTPQIRFSVLVASGWGGRDALPRVRRCRSTEREQKGDLRQRVAGRNQRKEFSRRATPVARERNPTAPHEGRDTEQKLELSLTRMPTKEATPACIWRQPFGQREVTKQLRKRWPPC